MAPDAPVLHDDLFTAGRRAEADQAVEHRQEGRASPRATSRPASREADVIIERRYTTQPVHQAYIEPHACVVSVAADGQCTIWSSSQGQFMVRAYCAKLLGIDIANIRAIPAEIGGGFGGKTLVYLEPVALALSKKTGRPVKIVMSREEVFRGTGPTSGAVIEVKLGAKKDGTIAAAEARAEIPGRRLPGLAGRAGLHVRLCDVRPPECQHHRLRRRVATGRRSRPIARRARRSRRSAVESCLDELARELGIDPLELREMNARQGRHQGGARPDLDQYRLSSQTLEAAQEPPALQDAARPEPGPRHRLAASGSISAASRARPCTSTRTARSASSTGNPDIGGSRASMAMMVAEVLGIPYERVRPIVGDTTSIGFTLLTGGSRVTFATGMAVTQAAEKVVERAEEARRDDLGHQPRGGRVEGRQGLSRPAPMPAASSRCRWPRSRSRPARTGGPISAEVSLNAQGAGPGFATHICDVEVDRRPATSRSCATPRSRMSAARSTRPMSKARSRAASPRGSAGRSTRNTSTTRTGGSITPASSTTACRSPPTCR